MEEINDENKKKKIEIVQGDPKDLKISEVKDSLSFENKREEENKENVIIPQNQKK